MAGSVSKLGGSTTPTGGPSAPAQDRAQLWAEATQAAADAAEQVRVRADSGDAAVGLLS